MTIHPHVQKLLGICALAATLAGCSNAESHTHAAASNRAETTSDAAPAASVEDPETTGDTLFGVPVADLPFGPGPFDRDAPDFDQFNPCTEIPEEIINSLGFESVPTGSGPTLSAGVAACPISELFDQDSAVELNNSSFVMISTTLSLEESLDAGFKFFTPPDDDNFSAYTGTLPMNIGGCSAGIITDRGRWEIQNYDMLGRESDENSCSEATSFLKSALKSFHKEQAHYAKL